MRPTRTLLTAIVTALLVVAAPAAAQANGVMEGHVTDAAGRPLDNMCVSVRTEQGPDVATPKTNASGAWSASIPAGSYEVEFTSCFHGPNYIPQYYPNRQFPGGGPPGTVTVADGQTVGGIDAAMQVGGQITGSIFDMDSGQPLGGSDTLVEVSTLGTKDEDASPFGDTDANDDGSFTISYLPTGTYLVEVQALTFPGVWYLNSADPGHAQRIQVTAGQTTRLVPMTVGRGGAVIGVLRDWHGRPVAKASMYADVIAPDGSRYAFGGNKTDEAGHFVFPQLAPDTYTIVPVGVPRGNLPATAEATVTEGGMATADITLGRPRQPTRLKSLRVTRRRRTLRLAGRISDPDRVRGRVTLTFGPLLHRRTIRLSRLRAARGHFKTRARLPKRYKRLRRPLLWIHVDGDRLYKPGTFCRALVSGDDDGCVRLSPHPGAARNRVQTLRSAAGAAAALRSSMPSPAATAAATRSPVRPR